MTWNIFGWQMAEFPPGEWGTYGQWASAVITGSAFFATFYVIKRDAKVRRYAQARKVVYYAERKPVSKYEDQSVAGGFVCIVKNLSDEPIYGVIYFDPKYNAVIATLTPVLLPGGEVRTHESSLEIDLSPKIAFRDNGGWNWNRDLMGSLHERGGPINRAKRTMTSKKPD